MDGARGQKNLLCHRGYCRTILQGQGIEKPLPVWTVGNLCDVLSILRDSATALEYIHGAGWVHRDISAGGNIYSFKEHKARGLIADPEFVKKVIVEGSHQIRTGTPYFMAVEVLQGTHLFVPVQIPKETNRDRLRDFALGKKLPHWVSVLPFVQNEAHDIESLWWLANHILFFNCQCGVDESPSRQGARMEYMQKVFPNSGAVKGRINFLVNMGDYQECTSWFPSSFLKLRVGLDGLRDFLVGHYYNFERTLPKINRNAFGDLQDATFDTFEGCRRIARGIAITSFKASRRQRQDDLSQRIGECTTSPGPAPAEPLSTDARNV